MAERARPRWALTALTLAALAGAADQAVFTATQPAVALRGGGRAAGTLAGLAVWVALTGVAAARAGGVSNPPLRRATLPLAAVAAVDGVGLAAIHAAAHVGGWRTAIGAGAGVVVLVLALQLRNAR